MPDITMPRLSDSMEEGTILKWLKSDGDEVSEGDELAEIETDKATMTYEADASGVLEIVADEGQTLAIGEVIAKLKGEGEEDSGDSDEEPAEEEGEESSEDEEPSEDEDAEEPDEDAEEPDGDEEPSDGEEPDEDADDEQDAGEDEEPAEDEEGEPAEDEVSEDEAPSEDEAAEEAASAPSEDDGERVVASPVARRLARERGVDLSGIEGTGPGGRIVKADVEGAKAEPQAEEAPAEEEPAGDEASQEEAAPEPAGTVAERGTAKGDVVHQEPSRLQGVVARRMAESKATIPDFVIRTVVDMEGCVGLRGQIKERLGPDATVPSYNDMVVKACALALREFPRANGAYRDGRFELYSRVNVGVAVAGQDALVVPTVFDADKRSLGDIARATRELSGKVRDGKISPPELSGGTFTVSNLGMYGVTGFTAVINPPQAAILAVGAMAETPVVVDGRVTVRNRMEIALTCDHRILYGADAAQFLARIRELLEEPLALVL
jgi:pyruvate dehydrogenase E2 component (dihydrolipoamide acetyltransferase)